MAIVWLRCHYMVEVGCLYLSYKRIVKKKGLIIHKHNSNNLIISLLYNGHRNEVSEC